MLTVTPRGRHAKRKFHIDWQSTMRIQVAAPTRWQLQLATSFAYVLGMHCFRCLEVCSGIAPISCCFCIILQPPSAVGRRHDYDVTTPSAPLTCNVLRLFKSPRFWRRIPKKTGHEVRAVQATCIKQNGSPTWSTS